MWKARWFGTLVAVKGYMNIEESSYKDFLKEVEVFVKLSHPRLCRLYGISINDEDGSLYLVNHFYHHGAIWDYFQKNDVSKHIKYKMILQACLGVHFLHSNNVVHRGNFSLKS